MKGLIYKSLLLLVTAPLCAIKSDPWIPPPYELNAEAGYSYAYFPSVDNAINPSSYSSFVNTLDLGINGAFTTELFCEIDFEFDATRKVDFNLESFAPCIKYQMLNDLTGDSVALLVGTYFRYVPENRLRDVATPYSGEYNFDFLLSIGKEFDVEGKMAGRTYAMLDVGIATRGSPWLLLDIMGEALFFEHNVLYAGVDAYFGFGNDSQVDVNNFYGYGDINHNSINIKLGYGYKFSVWGEIELLYKRRVVAISYPSDQDYIGLSYNVSFSF
ncbi:MAG: hypothetical protein SP4CHLAM5_01370 [Chlamydiia bacterium]|nr:hypothetical protein [Chlamydiia bacterium]MCH9618013.1 hypothetical protein [Chlamydiia bacterium]MCH9623662.1 hypothetical protein [Chlamydiia bacterium]